jgi:elongation factor G
MKVYSSKEIKNIALLGNDGAGKTTLTETMLFVSGQIARKGRISQQSTVSDYFPVEKNYGYSIFSTPFYTEWNGKKLNIIDCPGSDNFAGQAITAMSVTDTTLILVNGSTGPEVGTQNHFRYAEQLNKPVIFLVNQLDSPKCDFATVVSDLKASYGSRVIEVQYPVKTGEDFHQLIDVILMKQLTYSEDGKLTVEEIPASEMDRATEMHHALVEAAAEGDESLMEKFFEADTLTEDEMREGIRKGLVSRSIYPVFCVCAYKNMGVDRLMEFLGNVVPFVNEMPAVHNTRGEEIKPDPAGPVSLYFYKTGIEPHIGEVQYFKVMSGTVREGDDLVNADRGSREHLSTLYVCSGANRDKVSELQAGDIGCTVKLKDTRTGNTLNQEGIDWKFNFVKYPPYKITRAISAANKADTEKMMQALTRMRLEDPTWEVEQSRELKQTLIHGQGELHLRVLEWRLKNIDKLDVLYSSQRIPYRETITKVARAEYRHKKQSGGAGQFGEVHLIVEPYQEGMSDPTVYNIQGKEYRVTMKGKEEIELPWGGHLVFINSVVGGAIDARFMPAILKGIQQCMEQSPLTGSYARDVRVVVYDGKMHPVDSNELSFMLAARNAFSEAFRQAGPKILEPIYDLEVICPDEFVGNVMTDIQNRRGLIIGMSAEKGYQKLQAKVPLSELSDYSTMISATTGGAASFSMVPATYELCPNDVQERLIAAHAKEEAEA